MNSQRLIKLLIHPFFIGLLITAIIAIAFMPDIHKYKVEVVEKQNTPSVVTTLYADLDNDKNYERIRIHDTPQVMNIMFYRGNAFVEQYNLKSKPIYPDHLYIGDYNDDGFAEVFLLTRRKDSIFLSIIDPLATKEFIVKERLIYYSDSISLENEAPMSRFVGLLSYGDSPEKDAVFAIQAGFNKQPRNFFKYNIKNNKLSVSPLSGVSHGNVFVEDLNSDSNPEILFTTRATGNHEHEFPYTDQSAWLMVLDKNMEYVFEPIEFPKYPSTLVVSPFKSKDSAFIVAVHHYHGMESIPSSLIMFDHEGNKLLSRPIEKVSMDGYYLTATQLKGRSVICLLDASNSKATYLNEQLEEIHSFPIPELRYGWMINELDLDFDGTKEKIFHGRSNGNFVIFRENFKHAVAVDLGENEVVRYLSPYRVEGIPYVYAQFQNSGYLLRYKSDPLYYLKYPLLLLFYLAVSLVIYLIFRLQKYRAERVYLTEKKISELQILNLKNQIDPHFTFNILNSIGSLYTRGADRNVAYKLFVKYSNLLRFTIQNSDNISIPIKDELDFVNTYVELEQFRSNNAFEYKMSIDDAVDLNKKIPRMLIHSFVENSIKHGVRMAEKDARLEVKITRNKNSLQIQIRDNGPGLNSKTDKQVHSTGKGLQIIDEMLSLFFQLEGVRITYSLVDLSTQEPNRQGTIARLIILDLANRPQISRIRLANLYSIP